MKVHLKRYRWLAIIFCGPAAYLIAALIGSHVPVNAGWRAPANGVTIYVTDNGYHTGLILPASAEGVDLSLTFRPTDLSNSEDAGNWLLFGWGDQEFYLNTPTWAEFRLQTALAAFVGSGGSLLHVDHLVRPQEAYASRPIRITRAQYQRLAQRIINVAKRGDDGHPVAIPGYSERDVFYPANGRYHAFQTCNNWTRDMLAGAGIKVGAWTPFSGGVMRWF